MTRQSTCAFHTTFHMFGMILLCMLSLYLVVQFAIFADPRQTGTYDYSLSIGGTEVFALNGITVPLSVWLKLAVLEVASLWGAISALRAWRRNSNPLSLMLLFGIGYVLYAILPLYFSQFANLVFN